MRNAPQKDKAVIIDDVPKQHTLLIDSTRTLPDSYDLQEHLVEEANR